MQINKINSISNFNTKIKTAPVLKGAKNITKKVCLAGLMALSINNMVYAKNNTIKSEEVIASSINDFKKDYGKYGEYYTDNIPDKENITEHKKALSKLSSLYEKIQGNNITNPAFLNGLTVSELNNKCIKAAEKIVNGEHFGHEENTLVLIGFENGLDDDIHAFENDFKKSTMAHSNNMLCEQTEINNDKSFFSNYDNIIFIQPQKNCDEVLDKAFGNINNSLEKGANIDIAIIGHGNAQKDGIALSNGDTEECTFDISDFSNNGNSFAQNIKEMFENNIKNNNTPRIIGLSCNSEFLQKCIDEILPQNKNNVKVFGTPYEIMGNYVIGFSDNKLSVVSLTTPIDGKNTGIVFNLTEDMEYKSNNNFNVKDFTLTTSLQDLILNSNQNNGYGTFTKNNNMIMEYQLVNINK